MSTLFTYDHVRRAYDKYGYAFFKSKPYDLNLFGIRSENNDQSKDKFDDFVGCAYVDDKLNKRVDFWQATTDPGLRHLTNPTFAAAIKDGTAIMCEGQYRGAYQLGYHGSGNWRHRALVQVGTVKAYRDKNRDEILDMAGVPIHAGHFGLNIHAASLWKAVDTIGGYSAGCQVIRIPDDFFDLIDLCEKQVANGLGSRFTYTLFRWNQIAEA